MTTTPQKTGDNQRTLGLLVAVLGPPLLWLIQFQVHYSLVPWVCLSGNRWALTAASLAAIALALALCAFAWALRRVTTAPQSGGEAALHARYQFLALLGVMSSVLFLLVIVAQAIAQAYYDPCVT